MARQSRRRREEQENGHDRWLITYSDLITLLLIFFVVMYAMSSKISAQKFQALEASFARAFHQNQSIAVSASTGNTALLSAANPTDSGQKLNPGAANKQTAQDKAFDSLYQKINTYIHQHNLQANVTLTNQARGIQVTFRDVVLFDTGKAVIKQQAKQILDGLEPFLASVNNPIVVEGYTDNQPIHTPQFPSNWELSAARATNVVKFYAADGIDPTRLSEVGYGQYHPIAKNDTPANRQKNRRVNIVIERTLSTSSGSSTATANTTTTATGGSSGTGNSTENSIDNTTTAVAGGGNTTLTNNVSTAGN